MRGANLHHNDDNRTPGQAHKLSGHDFTIAEHNQATVDVLCNRMCDP